MIEIKALLREDMAEAVGLKVLCWPEETAGMTDVQLDFDKELAFFTDWAQRADENDDVRMLLGAYEQKEGQGRLLGVAFASFVESKSEPECGIELNGLWVYKAHRGRGVSFMLLEAVLSEFRRLGAKKFLVYNYHCAPSNTFYRYLGCTVTDTELQTKDKLLTDIFTGDIDKMLERIALSQSRTLRT